ncbi:MAG: FAD-dependent oxidoreductase [Acidimicrobiia bacterium]|nr:FAD-dependent oxidoreductase [Acidimicrobiia bacterium]
MSDASLVEPDIDVLVVGSGAAGLSAALSAREAGAERVLVAEGGDVVGGSSRLSGGLIMGAGTRHQAAAGIADDTDALYHDYMQANRWDVDAAVVRRFCDMSGVVVDWLADLGVEFHERLVRGGDELVPRVHVPVGSGQAVIDVLHRHCRERDVDIALGRRVDRLLVSDDPVDEGAVRGVAVGDDEITAASVVIATGGFGASHEMLAAHFPSAAATEWAWYIGADGARGDAIDLAGQVRAQLTGHDRGLRLLDVGFDHVFEAFLPGWLVMVDREGRRFIDETAPYGMIDSAVRAHGDSAFVIFDDATLHAAAGEDQWSYSIPGHPRITSPHWNPDIVEQMIVSGRVRTAPTISDLADLLHIPADALAGTVERYNLAAQLGADLQCAKDPKFLAPVSSPPFYGAELRPATVCSTAYGLRITPDARVVGTDGRPIRGLFAGGECTGGVVGAQYVGSGNNYANCVVMGNIAGRSAAE